MEPSRRLAAILFTDIVGSTSMMQKDERTAVSVNKRYVEVLKQCVLSRGGELLNDYGDGSLCCFHSATDAMRCAVEMQQLFQQEPKVPLRIGVHVGEIFFEDGKVFGDGVNVASRVQSLGIANSILFSPVVKNEIKNQQEFKCVSIGKFDFKNVDESIEVFALANEGFVVPKKGELKGKLQEIEKRSFQKKMIIIFAALAVMIAVFFLWYKFFNQSNFLESEKSIAVLPFDNTGINDSDLYVTDGISQDIINNLSKISSLKKVIAWLSVKGFRKPVKSLRQIADELGVSAILTGTIEKHADKIQVFVELIDASTNKTLWGNDYSYDWNDFLSNPEIVAQEIVTAFSGKLSAQEKKEIYKSYTENPEAYKFYRKGRYFWDLRNKKGYDSAAINYKRAIELDPDYALAYSGMADLNIYPVDPFERVKVIPIARDYASKALLLDSTLSEALTTIGFIQSDFDYDWSKSKTTLLKAIRVNPNYSMAHVYYGNLLEYTGENVEQGINETKKGLELDPLSSIINFILGRNYYLAGKFDLAYVQLQKTLTLYPKNVSAKGVLIEVLVQTKKYSEALELCKQLPLREKGEYMYQGPYLSYIYAAMGDTVRAKMELEKTIKEDPDQYPYQLARVYILLKDFNKGMELLEHAYDIRDMWMYFIKVDPTFVSVRNEPRFKALLKKMNLD